MIFVEYVKAMLASESIIGYVGLGIVGLFLLVILTGLLRGFRLGAKRQLARTINTVLALAVAFFAADFFSTYLINLIDADTVNMLVDRLESQNAEIASVVREVIPTIDFSLIRYILLLPSSTIFTPVVFIFLFFIVNLILKIIYLILVKVFRLAKADGIIERLAGMCLGVVEASIFITVLLVPFSGILGIVDESYSLIKESSEDVSRFEQFDEIYLPIAENPVFEYTNKVGDEMIVTAFATVKIDGKNVDMREDVISTCGLVVDFMSLGGNFTKENDGVISGIINKIDSSPFLSNTVSGAVRILASIAYGSDFVSSIPAPADTIVKDLLIMFEASTKETLFDDIRTLKDVYYILSEEGGIIDTLSGSKSDKALADALSKKDENGVSTVSRLVATLNSNPRMKGVVTTLTKLSIDMFTTNIEIEGVEITEDTYETVKGAVNEVLSIDKESYGTEEEYKGAISNTINEKLEENGIALDEEVVSSVTDHIVENYEGKTELTEEEFNDLLLSYYEKYVSENNGGDSDGSGSNSIIPDGSGSNSIIPDGLIPDGFLPGN